MKTNDQSAAVLEVQPPTHHTANLKPRTTRQVSMNRDVIDLLEVILAASGTNLTVGEYVERSIIEEVAESLLAERIWCGVQDHLDGEYVLEPQDMLNMNAAAQRWASENPEAAARIEARR